MYSSTGAWCVLVFQSTVFLSHKTTGVFCDFGCVGVLFGWFFFVSNEVVLLLFLVLLIYFLKTDNLFHSNRFIMKRHA